MLNNESSSNDNQYQQELESVTKEKKTLLVKIDELNKTIQETKENLDSSQTEINQLNEAKSKLVSLLRFCVFSYTHYIGNRNMFIFC